MGVMSHHAQNFKTSEISHFNSNSSDIKITLTSKGISLLHLTKSSHVAAKAQNCLPYGHVVKPTTQNGFFGTCSLPLFDAIFACLTVNFAWLCKTLLDLTETQNSRSLDIFSIFLWRRNSASCKNSNFLNSSNEAPRNEN